MYQLFEFLNKTGLSNKKVYSNIQRFSSESLIETAFQLNSLISNTIDTKQIPQSRYNFVVADRLGGGVSGCSYVKCRENKINDLNNFSSLYADHIWIRNGFEQFLAVTEFDYYSRNYFADEVYLLWKMEPLLIRNYASFCIEDYHICNDCLAKFSKNKIFNYEDTLETAASFIYKEIKETIQYDYEKKGKERIIYAYGSKDIIEHEELLITLRGNTPRSLLKYNKEKGRSRIDGSDLDKAKLYDNIAVPIIEDYCIQNWYLNKYHSNYITDRGIDIKISQMLSTNNMSTNFGKIGEIFNANLPVINTNNASKIITLRENEGEAFINYRKALNELLNLVDHGEYKNIVEASNDIVKPEICKINNVINKAISSKLITLGKDIFISTGLISIGLYSGILPQNIGDIVSTIGGFDLAKSLIIDTTNLFKPCEEAKSNPYYFLWKVKRKIT